MGSKAAAAAEHPPGACATFFVGTPQSDDQLALARIWAQSIVGAVADGNRAQVMTLVSPDALLNQLIALEGTVAGNAVVDAPPAPLGGIAQPTIVLVTRALDGATASPQGLLFYGLEDGDDAVLVTDARLDALSLQDVSDPSPRQQVVAGQNADDNTAELARLLDFMRRSSYTALYLCAVGGGNRAVDQLAKKLATLVDMVVYYNQSALVLGADDDGNLQPPQVGDDLKAGDASSFLPGAEQKAS